ncbi:1940_t:CDS:2, partial [Paraglomus occultum]
MLRTTARREYADEDDGYLPVLISMARHFIDNPESDMGKNDPLYLDHRHSGYDIQIRRFTS